MANLLLKFPLTISNLGVTPVIKNCNTWGLDLWKSRGASGRCPIYLRSLGLNRLCSLTGRLGPPPAAATALLLHGRDRRRGGLLVAQLEVGAHLVADVALRSDDVPLAVGGGVGLVEDGAGAAGRANHPVEEV